jgi:hypothetical protein
MNRRHFLRGAGGVVVALPFLETFAAKSAVAQDGGYPPYALFIRQANGVVQETNNEPEMYFPGQTGALTTAGMAGLTDRAVSVLSDYADKLTIVRGVSFAFPGNGCGHSGGGNQCLTAAKVSPDLFENDSLAMGESIDNRIATQLHPDVEPLTLYAGRMAGYINEVLSYRGPKDLRSAQPNPFLAYQDLFGLAQLEPEVLARLKLQRTSVNDLVREEMTALLARTDLSADDRARLDLHFSSIKDLEETMTCELPEMEVAEMEAFQNDIHSSDGDNVIKVAQMQMDILALAFACGVVQSATLQIGDGNDSTRYWINGEQQYSFHWISHRIQGDGDEGAVIENAYLLHHEIDKIHLNLMKYMLDKLSQYSIGSGTLLDSGIVVLTNDLSNKYHSYNNVPYVIAGSANGALKTGHYIDAGDVRNNKLFNTIGTAVGCTNAEGGPLDDFGDPELEKGLIDAMLA